MNNIKKYLFVILCLTFVLLMPTKRVSGEDNFVIKINISGGNGEYTVELQDDPYYAEKNPTVFVNTDIEGNLARVIDENNKEIPSKLVNGEVSFKVNKGGIYKITKGTEKTDNKPSRTTTPTYVFPKTGIE